MRKGSIYKDKTTGNRVFVDQRTGEVFAELPEAAREIVQARNPQYEAIRSGLKFNRTLGHLGFGPDLSDPEPTTDSGGTFWTKLSDSFNNAWTNDKGEPSTFQNLFTKVLDNVSFNDGVQWGAGTQPPAGPVDYGGQYGQDRSSWVTNQTGLYIGGGIAFAALIYALVKANN